MARMDSSGPAPQPPSWLPQLPTANGPVQMSDVESLLQQTLFGTSGRRGLTRQPLVGIIPNWVRHNPNLFSAVRAGVVDPYLPIPGEEGSWRVFVGRGDTTRTTAGSSANAAEYRAPRLGDKTKPLSAVANEPYLWSAEKINDAIKKFNEAGIPVRDLEGVVGVWGKLSEQAAKRYSLSSGKLKVTPWDMLEINKSALAAAGGSGSGSGGGTAAPTTVRSTTRSVAQITHGDGWNALQNTLSRMLGRDPSEEEVKDFIGRMNHLAAKNPTITTSTTTGVGTASQNTSSKTRGGFNANDILENAYRDAQADEEYAEYQSATTYFNAALSALGAIGG